MQIRELEWLVVDEQEEAVLWRQQLVERRAVGGLYCRHGRCSFGGLFAGRAFSG
jgi:hypothetical protein